MSVTCKPLGWLFSCEPYSACIYTNIYLVTLPSLLSTLSCHVSLNRRKVVRHFFCFSWPQNSVSVFIALVRDTFLHNVSTLCLVLWLLRFSVLKPKMVALSIERYVMKYIFLLLSEGSISILIILSSHIWTRIFSEVVDSGDGEMAMIKMC